MNIQKIIKKKHFVVENDLKNKLCQISLEDKNEINNFTHFTKSAAPKYKELLEKLLSIKIDIENTAIKAYIDDLPLYAPVMKLSVKTDGSLESLYFLRIDKSYIKNRENNKYNYSLDAISTLLSARNFNPLLLLMLFDGDSFSNKLNSYIESIDIIDMNDEKIFDYSTKRNMDRNFFKDLISTYILLNNFLESSSSDPLYSINKKVLNGNEHYFINCLTNALQYLVLNKKIISNNCSENINKLLKVLCLNWDNDKDKIIKDFLENNTQYKSKLSTRFLNGSKSPTVKLYKNLENGNRFKNLLGYTLLTLTFPMLLTTIALSEFRKNKFDKKNILGIINELSITNTYFSDLIPYMSKLPIALQEEIGKTLKPTLEKIKSLDSTIVVNSEIDSLITILDEHLYFKNNTLIIKEGKKKMINKI